MKKTEQPEKSDNLIFDVGMHMGEDTDYYLKKGYKVIAFEADPNLAAQCRMKFAEEIKSGKLIIIEGAIVDFTSEQEPAKTVKFFRNKDVSVWGTVIGDWAHRNEFLGSSNEIIEVAAIDFSEYLKTYGIPYFLKIDIEGMDLVCLKALKDFEIKPDYVSIESEKISFDKLKEEFELFTSLGYTEFQAVNQQMVPRQLVPLNSKQGQYSGYIFEEGSSGLFGTDLPDKWKNHNQILKVYKKIFINYKLFGDYGKLRNNLAGKIILKIINLLSTHPIPGWYDTHARHDSVTDNRQ